MRIDAILAVLCFCLFLQAACNKSDKKDANVSAQQQLLVAGKWKISASTATLNYMGTDTTIDTYGQMADCDKDDFIKFADNGSGFVDENVNKCTDDQQIENFTWALLNGNTELAIVDSNPDTLQLEISGTQMKLKQTKPNSSGTPVTTVRTYVNIE